MSIDKIIEADENEVFDGKHVWVALDGEIDWANGTGFIYRNFIGVSKTKAKALEQIYSKMRFCGGDWKIKIDEETFVRYDCDNGKFYVIKYDLEGPSIFDLNH